MYVCMYVCMYVHESTDCTTLAFCISAPVSPELSHVSNHTRLLIRYWDLCLATQVCEVDEESDLCGRWGEHGYRGGHHGLGVTVLGERRETGGGAFSETS